MNNWFRFWAICVLLIIVLWPASSVNAQNETVQYGKENIARDYLTEYKITVKCDIEDNNVYLYDCLFGHWRLIDSAIVTDGKAVFSRKCPAKTKTDVYSNLLIPKGFYKVSSKLMLGILNKQEVVEDISIDLDMDSDSESKQDKKSKSNDSDEGELDFFEIALDHKMILNQQNSVEIDMNLMNNVSSVLSSEENKVLSSINKMLTGSEDLFASLKSAAELASSMPQSFLGQYYQSYNEVVQTIRSASFLFSAIKPSDFHRALSLTDFTDGRLCHSESMLFLFIQGYLTSNARESVDEIITEVDTILMRAARGGRYQCGMYAKWLYEIFDKTGDPYYEPVMLHIYDTYDRGWIPEDQERRVKRQMDRIRKLAPGAQIPELTAFDINGKQHSTNDIKTKYTVLWFWDPDCDHCQEETPILHDIYQKQADELNFEVFAVEVNDDYDRWKAFSEKYGLGDWINLSTSMGEASVDFIEYFDIVTTPVILLIDNENNHAIIARQVTLDELVRTMKR